MLLPNKMHAKVKVTNILCFHLIVLEPLNEQSFSTQNIEVYGWEEYKGIKGAVRQTLLKFSYKSIILELFTGAPKLLHVLKKKKKASGHFQYGIQMKVN